MHCFTYDLIRFYYEDDVEDVEPFIFLHGLSGDVTQTFGLMKQTDHLRRISLDFRGHGKTVAFGHADESLLGQFKYPYVKETSMKFVKLPTDYSQNISQTLNLLRLLRKRSVISNIIKIPMRLLRTF